MKIKFAQLFIVLGAVAFSQFAHAQSHGHLNIGATGTSQNDKLTFDNGADFAADSDYVKTLIYTNSATYAGFYAGNITLTVLAATFDYGGPAENAPALGSHIKVQIVSVEGPVGGAFNFWESGATKPTFSVESGATSTNFFDVSQTDGSPGIDPFGHIHGRQFTATKPGIYTVALRAFDVSTNGENGGPIHTPSDVVKIYFEAGLNIASVKKTGTINAIRFGTIANQTVYLESKDNLSAPNWTTVDSVSGNDRFQTLEDSSASPQRFYRLRATTP